MSPTNAQFVRPTNEWTARRETNHSDQIQTKLCRSNVQLQNVHISTCGINKSREEVTKRSDTGGIWTLLAPLMWSEGMERGVGEGWERWHKERMRRKKCIGDFLKFLYWEEKRRIQKKEISELKLKGRGLRTKKKTARKNQIVVCVRRALAHVCCVCLVQLSCMFMDATEVMSQQTLRDPQWVTQSNHYSA